jgi:hypothetical protein
MVLIWDYAEANLERRHYDTLGSPLLALHKLFDDPKHTFERTKKHLADNGGDIDETRLTVGPWLEFDPDRKRFIGNAAADAMLTREYREPFVVPAESEV